MSWLRITSISSSSVGQKSRHGAAVLSLTRSKSSQLCCGFIWNSGTSSRLTWLLAGVSCLGLSNWGPCFLASRMTGSCFLTGCARILDSFWLIIRTAWPSHNTVADSFKARGRIPFLLPISDLKKGPISHLRARLIRPRQPWIKTLLFKS